MEARLKGSALKSRGETSGMDRTIEGGETRGEMEKRRGGTEERREPEASRGSRSQWSRFWGDKDGAERT